MKIRLLIISIILAFVTVRATAQTITTAGNYFTVPGTTYGTAGTATSSTTFTVGGSGLSTAGIKVTPASSYLQVSLSATSGFANSVTIPTPSGSVAATPVYVRIISTAPVQGYQGTTITCVNGSISQTVNCNFTVSTAPLTITLNVPNKVYGSSYNSGSGSTFFTSTGLQNGETVGSVTVNYYGGGTASNAAVGTYSNVQVSGATGGTFNSSNYNITYNNGSGSFNVVPLAITVSPAAANNKPYDGTNAATISGTLVGVINGDVVTLVGTGTFASVNVGTGISVTSTSTLSGSGASNYTLTQPTGLSANITQSTLTITANNVTKTYGTAITGGSGSTAFTTTGLMGTQTVGSVTIAYGSAASATGVAGTYPNAVTPSAATGGTFVASNYTIVYQSNYLTVSPKVLTLTSPAASNKAYDGTTTATITGTLTGIVNSDVVTLVGTGTFASANVGTGIAVTAACTLSGTGAGNYTLTQPTGLTANIAKAALTITATGPQYAAGQTMSTTTGSTTNFTYSGTVNGETVTSVTLTPNMSGAYPAGTSYIVTPSAPAGSTAFNTSNYTITYVNFSGVVGTSYTWTGTTSMLWNVSTNWSPAGVPGTNDNITIPATTNKPTVNVTEACGSVNITGTTTLTLSYPLTVSGSLTIGGNGYTFTVAGTSTSSFGGLTDIAYQSSMVINSGATVSFNSNSTVNNNSSQNSITNNGTLNFGANCVMNTGYATSLINTSTGTISATSTTLNFPNTATYISNAHIFKATSCAFNITGSQAYFLNSGSSASFTTYTGSFTTSGSSAGYFSNTSGATYLDHGSTFTMTGTNNYINNAATMTLHGTTINFNAGSNPQYISNSGTFKIDSGATVNLNSYQSYITNTAGTFYAGTSNSPCKIYLSAQSSNVSNNGGIFNLASTSVIYPSGATCYVNNNSGTFTLQSDVYGTASIMSFYTTGGNLATSSGNFNVQRYVTGGTGYRGYRLLSSPVNYSFSYSTYPNIYTGNYALKYVNTDVTTPSTAYAAITGGPGSSFTVNIPNPTMYLYNESLATYNGSFTGGKDAGITSVTSTTVNTLSAGTTTSGVSIPVGNGYFLFYIGNDATGYTTISSSPTAATLTATGPLNLQSIPVKLWWNSSTSLSYTSSYGTNAGYNLVGNPYPCAIDLHQVYTDNSSVYPNFAELNDYGQTFIYYNASTGGTSTPATYRYVASGQGFFVQATATGQTLTFNEDQKYYATNLLNDNGSSPAVLLSLHPKTTPFGTTTDAIIEPTNVLSGLHLMLKQDSTNYTYCGIYFNKNWSDTYDNKTDAFDLGGLGAKVLLSSYTSDNVRTGINSLGDYSKGKKIKLYVMATTNGIYHLTLNDIANIDTTNFNVYLIDNANNDSLDMVHYKTYNFSLTAADTAAFHNRFVLVIERKAMPLYSLITFTGKKANTAIQLNWKTSGEGNYTGFGLEKLGANGQYALIDSVQSGGTGLYTFNDQNPISGNNIYRLSQNDVNGNVTFAGPININYNATSTSGVFTIYPNPSKDIINIAVNSGTAGNAVIQTYLANIYSLGGTLVNTRQLNTNNFTQDITSYKPGVYILELKTTDGDIIGKAKFVKTN